MSSNRKKQHLSRRGFVKGSALGALAVAASGSAFSSLYGCSTDPGAQGGNGTDDVVEKVTWSCCSFCGDSCAIRVHTVDGVITQIETDNINDNIEVPQMRCCARGRSLRWHNSGPDRIKYPMKRVGKRGDAEFERIGWDEAMDILEEKIKYTIDTYGNEAILLPNPWSFGEGTAFFNLIGGHLGVNSNLSAPAYAAAVGLWGAGESSPLLEARNADIMVMFGNDPVGSRQGGAGAANQFLEVRAAGTKIINIDPRMSSSAAGYPDEWIPIRLGTDAALIAGLAYVLITEGLADEEFLHKYTQGYDEQTMPEGAPPNASYKDYVLGTGYDMVAKTPEWAAAITQIPAQRIIDLAHELSAAETVFISQGFGIQRQSNGEASVLAVMTLPLLLGQLGKPGTNNGGQVQSGRGTDGMDFPYPKAFSDGAGVNGNPYPGRISEHMWFQAVERGDKLTSLNGGIQGVDKLNVSAKLLFVCQTNCLHNQGCDLNYMHDILTDESLAEFIVVLDPVLTSSARYADLLLPKTSRVETSEIRNAGMMVNLQGGIFTVPAVEPYYESRTPYEIFTELAERFGVQEEYTQGREWEDWMEWAAEGGRKNDPRLPSLQEGRERGIVMFPIEYPVGMKAFIEDPEANPTWLPSGKIEIYSQALAGMSAAWELEDPRDQIPPIPMYFPGPESYQDLTEEYPLLIGGFKSKGGSNSNFSHVDMLLQAIRREVWINPVDAEPRGIKHGDTCRVFNDRGEIHIDARVTPTIIPGVIGLPSGTWHKADENDPRIDVGGCPNTLTSSTPTPIAKGNATARSIGQIAKL